MPFILSGNVGSATAATGFDVDNSVRFNSVDSASMEKDAVAPTDNNKWTFSTGCYLASARPGNLFRPDRSARDP